MMINDLEPGFEEDIRQLSLFRPEYSAQSAWLGHLPFAYWLIWHMRPRCFVELGTHYGQSYFTFCQSAKKWKTATKCFAIDSWEGDRQAGFYNEAVFEQVSRYNLENYAEFSTLLRGYFDEKIELFADQSIDLLHIDGLHSYEAVKHDFESWFPKLTKNAIVLFHDTEVMKEGFGVHRFWAEISAQYPWKFNFRQSFGLGVLALSEGDTPPLAIFDDQNPQSRILRQFMTRLGLGWKAEIERDIVLRKRQNVQAQ